MIFTIPTDRLKKLINAAKRLMVAREFKTVPYGVSLLDSNLLLPNKVDEKTNYKILS